MIPPNFVKTLASVMKKSVSKLIKTKAIDVREAIKAEMKSWKMDVRGWLGRSHYARGKDTGGPTHYSGPYMISRKLRDSVHYGVSKLSYNKIADKWYFKVYHSYGAPMSETGGKTKTGRTNNRRESVDYSEILNNTEGRYYSHYKERYTADLNARLAKIIRRK